MPWDIVTGDERCPASQPFAVVGGASGHALFGCHATKEKARAQQKALYAAEDRAAGRPNVAEPFTLNPSPYTIDGLSFYTDARGKRHYY